MPFNERYRRQVELLISTLPYVAGETVFALKGGTAINLFIRNMPRLSVDIDLTYVPTGPRDQSLTAIDAAMKRLAAAIQTGVRGASVASTRLEREGAITKLTVRAGGAQIKIEVTPVMRGCVFEPEMRTVRPIVEDAFGFAEAQVVSFADLYAGKIVAALDRQHPRDLFDVRDLLANEGIDDDLRRAFIIYLLSHNRPMSEVITARRKDITKEFERGFAGMTDEAVKLDELLAAREAMVRAVIGGMPDEHRRFLISFERGEPDWRLLGVPSAAKLPAVQWRQRNLNSLKAAERMALVEQLKKALRE
jgi:predicted nucleotidyltransferase component of viral defense system